MKNIAACVLLVLVGFTGCAPAVPVQPVVTFTSNPSSANNQTSANIGVTSTGADFAIYLVANANPDLSKLELESKPWLSLADIDHYDPSSHYFYLKNRPTLDINPAQYFPAKPFVVVANGERCYLGYFFSAFSSTLPQGPYITYPSFLPDDVIAVKGATDVLNDPRIISALTQAGKINTGLRITLYNAKVISRADVVTMSYSFNITNESGNPLYVPDPDKMGSDLFHYYTNGLSLTNVNNPRESFWASLRKPSVKPDLNAYDTNWYTRLDSHQTMSRTVLLSGFPTFGKGVYNAYFSFSGPHNIPNSDRIRADGSIWIGDVNSNTIDVIIDD